MMLQVRARPRKENRSRPHYLLHLRSTSAPPAGEPASLSGCFLESEIFHLKLRAGLGHDLLRSLMFNDEVDPQSHLFLTPGLGSSRLMLTFESLQDTH